MNITTSEGYDHVTDRTMKGDKLGGQVDLVLSCVDNYSARMTINSICNRNNVIWFESGVSESALSGHIQVLVPGETGCFGCASPLAIAEGTEATIKREGVCAASLPTTMGIIAGFLSQATLKFLLNFGLLSYCLSYNAQSDFFSSYKIAINPECKEPSCQ
jgi:ubiquitin-like modifier-activating enzyme 5